MKKKLPELLWPEILHALENISAERPDIELALAEVYQQDYLHELNKPYHPIIAILLKSIKVSLLNGFRRTTSISNKKVLQKALMVFSINLPKANDFGIFYPVMTELNKRGINSTVLVTKKCYDATKAKLAKLQLLDIRIKENIFGSHCSLQRVMQLFLQACNSYQFLSRNVSDSRIKRYIRRHRSHFVKACFCQNINVEFLKVALADRDIRIIVSLGELLLGLLGQNKKSQVLALQHGSINPESIAYWNVFTTSNATEIGVFGRESARIVNSVYPKAKPVVLGNPFYDDKAKHCKERDPKTRLRITFFSSFHEFVGKDTIIDDKEFVDFTLETLLKIYSEFKEAIDLCIKTHPNEDPDYIRRHSPLFRKQIRVLSNIDSFQMLEESDVSISWGTSTTSLESIISGVPFIQLLSYPPHQKRIPHLDWAKKVFTEEELIAVISRLISDSSFYNELVHYERDNIKDSIDHLGSSAKVFVDYLTKNITP
jgi:hypothetical protein